MSHSFAQFLGGHALYRRSYERLAAADVILARSARAVVEIHGTGLGPTAESILAWCELHYGGDFIARYVERINALNQLQRRFEAAPSPQTLGDPTAKIHRESYDLALLLSFIYSNHRFEILQALQAFLAFIGQSAGRLVSIGVGTGYELQLILKALHGWTVEGYDSDDEARRHACSLLQHFSPDSGPQLGKLFPLDAVDSSLRGRFRAIVMCELLEHLSDPLCALETAREYLDAQGHMFVTMAVNIAQEDHVFLYPSVNACRQQLLQARLSVIREWVMPVILRPSMLQRHGEPSRGNYVAIVRA
jgi:methyltransferase family protein